MTVHIVGAGLAGLACAVTVVKAGKRVFLYERAKQCGGRCRSFYDTTLRETIDNGTHLIIGANTQALRYVDYLSSRHHFTVVKPAIFPFLDLISGHGWTLRPNKGKLPWWLLHPKRRVAESRLIDYLAIYRLLYKKSKHDTTVLDCLDGPLMRKLWYPLTEAVLNTSPVNAPAALLARIVHDSLMQGEQACRPYLARYGLSQALIDPALSKITAQGGILRLDTRLRAITSYISKNHRYVLRLHFGDETVETQPGDDVVLALPPWAITTILPELQVPKIFQSIVNVHFYLGKITQLPSGGPFLAVIGKTIQWLFIRDNILSVTIGASNSLVSRDNTTLAQEVWEDCSKILSMPLVPMPPKRVVREQRATILPKNNNQPSLFPLPGVILAGDWTYTSLPTTIEAAVSSGIRAAIQILSTCR